MISRLLFISALTMLFAFSMHTGITSAAGKEQSGGTIVYTKPLKAVTFSHDTHVGKQGFSCSMCHPRLFNMKALEVQEKADFTMAALEQGKYCGACHNGTMAFTSNSRCASCHSGVKSLPQEKKNGKAGH